MRVTVRDVSAQLFDKGDKGFITEDELCDVLYQAFGMGKPESRKIFAHIDRRDSHHITYGTSQARQPPHHLRYDLVALHKPSSGLLIQLTCML